MIFDKKRSFFEKKLSESIGKPKDLWKAPKSLGLPNKISSCEVSVLKINNTVEHTNSILEGFKNYYSTLAENLVNMLPLIYVNAMSQAVKCYLFLYADDTCLVCQHEDINKIKNQLNEDFFNICYWFVDNKLSTHFGEDKTKSILLFLNLKAKIFKNFT